MMRLWHCVIPILLSTGAICSQKCKIKPADSRPGYIFHQFQTLKMMFINLASLNLSSIRGDSAAMRVDDPFLKPHIHSSYAKILESIR